MRRWFLGLTTFWSLCVGFSATLFAQQQTPINTHDRIPNLIQQARSSPIDSLRQVLGLSSSPQIDWLTSTTGQDTFRITDNFNRTEIGSDWAFDKRFWFIKNGELVLDTTAIYEWRYLAVFKPVYNMPGRKIISVAYRWGENADLVGIGEGAHAMLIDRASSEGNGYWLWHRTNWQEVWLYAIKDGNWEYTPGETKQYDRQAANTNNPGAGDVITAKIRNETNGVFFDYYINQYFDATVKDYSKEFARNDTWYVGVFIHGQRLHNEVDDFTVTYVEGDKVPPATIADLAAVDSTISTIKLQWTSPGDNGMDGNADHLDIRYATAPITTANFAAATPAANMPTPATAGTLQTFTITGLNEFTTYYFAIKAYDEVNNASGLSNVVKVRTKSDGIAKNLAQISGCEQAGEVSRPLPAPMVVRVTDKNNQPVKGYTVKFSVTAGAGSLAGDTTTSTLTDSLGQASATLTLGPHVGQNNNIVTIETPGLTGSPLQCTASGQPGSAANLAYVSGCDQTGTVGAPLAMPLVVKVTDRNALPVKNTPAQFVITKGNGKFQDQTEITLNTDSLGLASAVWTLGTVAGSDQNEVEIRSGTLTGSPIQCRATAQPDEKTSQIARISLAQQVVSAGHRADSLVVRVHDAYDNPIANKAVKFMTTEGNPVAPPSTVQFETSILTASDSAGVAAVVFSASDIPGDTTQIAASLVDSSAQSNPSMFTIIAAAPDSMVAFAGMSQVGGVSQKLATPLAVRLFDSLGNPLPRVTVSFRITQGSGVLQNHLQKIEVQSDSIGVAQTTWTLGEIAGKQQVQATAVFRGENLRNAPITFEATAMAVYASPVKSSLRMETASVPADSQSTARITIILRDDADNLVVGKQIEILVSGENNFISYPSGGALTDTAGTAVAEVRSTRAGWKTITAFVLPDSVKLADSLRVRFKALSPMRLQQRSGDRQSGYVNKTLPEPVVVEVLDKYGNPTGPQVVTFNIIAGGGKIIGNAITLGDSNGIAKATWQLGSQPGTNRLLVRAGKLDGSPIEFVAEAIDTILTDVTMTGAQLPTRFVLWPNAPNPFNPETAITFDTPELSEIEIIIYNVTGRAVRHLAAGQVAAGHHRLLWNGLDDASHKVESGVYFCRMLARNGQQGQQFQATRKMLLVK